MYKDENVEDFSTIKSTDLLIKPEFTDGSSKESSTVISKLCIISGLILDFDVSIQIITIINHQTMTAVKLSLLICARRWIYAAALRH